MIELTSELKQQFKSYNQRQLNNAFIQACSNGHLNIVRYVLTSPELDIHANDDDAFISACCNGHLDVVKYLLTSPDLQEHADIHVEDDEGFRMACEFGHFDVVKYLLTSPELNDHPDIHADEDYGFRWACYNDNLDIVQYLLSFNDDQYINFQKGQYNLDWAIQNRYSDIVFAMIKHLYRHEIDVFNAHIESIMAYFMAESFEHGIAMMNECHLPPTAHLNEFNVTL